MVPVSVSVAAVFFANAIAVVSVWLIARAQKRVNDAQRRLNQLFALALAGEDALLDEALKAVDLASRELLKRNPGAWR